MGPLITELVATGCSKAGGNYRTVLCHSTCLNKSERRTKRCNSVTDSIYGTDVILNRNRNLILDSSINCRNNITVLFCLSYSGSKHVIVTVLVLSRLVSLTCLDSGINVVVIFGNYGGDVNHCLVNLGNDFIEIIGNDCFVLLCIVYLARIEAVVALLTPNSNLSVGNELFKCGLVNRRVYEIVHITKDCVCVIDSILQYGCINYSLIENKILSCLLKSCIKCICVFCYDTVCIGSLVIEAGYGIYSVLISCFEIIP